MYFCSVQKLIIISLQSQDLTSLVRMIDDIIKILALELGLGMIDQSGESSEKVLRKGSNNCIWNEHEYCTYHL